MISINPVKNMLNLREHRRVAVTGIAGGGKTVFLTSLVSHLAEFGQGSFHIGKGVDIKDFRVTGHKGKWPPEFNHTGFREDLARGEWPEKSTDCSELVCRFSRTDWRLFSQKMSFFDFPGERVADAAIAAHENYADWSDHILNHFAAHHDYSTAAGPFFEVFKAQSISEQELLSSYKQTLARLIHNYKPLISPSTFLLDQQGSCAAPAAAEELARYRYAGISSAEQFAPMSVQARKNNPELCQKMEGIYARYRRDVAMPVFEKLGKAESLIVLVDIPSLLAGGVGRYNDNRRILLDLFEALRPRSDIGSLLMKYLMFRHSLSRVAFVAAKADLVHPMDISSGRMINLLKMMTHRAAGMLPDVKCEWFVCSACHSTIAVEGHRRLMGKIVYDNPGRDFVEYNVPEVPEVWPESWEPGEYPFYRVFPDAPRNYLIPPKHSGLDRVFEFISGS